MGQDIFESPPFRVGQSYDIHPLVEGRALILAGIEIPYHKGLFGHSDADLVFHVTSDAALGALALGDLGAFFPDKDPRWKGVASSEIMKSVSTKVFQAGYRFSNVDITVIAQEPRLSPHIPKMVENLARHLELPISCVSIKARTHEKLGALGRGEGLAALGVVLLQRTEL